ncbi:MAG: hypothetical protein ACLGII_11045 [Gammaproteobacteria bacterium]
MAPADAAWSFRLLGEADLDGFALLHEEIRAAAPQGALSRRSRADLARLLEPGGFALGVFVLGRLAGFSCARRWRPGEDAPRLDAIGLPHGDWDRTAILTATGVAAWARGSGLQRLLLQERGGRLPGIGATHGAGVIHCANLASVANTLRAGEALRGVLDDEDGANYVSWRVARCVPRPSAAAVLLRLPVADVDAHRAAFARGLWCWSLETGQRDGESMLVFAAPDPGCV